jgi:hypothetical protein
MLRGEARGFIQPAGEDGSLIQSRGFSGKDDEHGLRRVLRVFAIAGESQRDGIDEVDVPVNQIGESGFRIPSGVFAQQGDVVRVWHLLIIPACAGNWTFIFTKPRKIFRGFFILD